VAAAIKDVCAGADANTQLTVSASRSNGGPRDLNARAEAAMGDVVDEITAALDEALPQIHVGRAATQGSDPSRPRIDVRVSAANLRTTPAPWSQAPGIAGTL